MFDKYNTGTSVGIFVPNEMKFRVTLRNNFWIVEEKTKKTLEFIFNRYAENTMKLFGKKINTQKVHDPDTRPYFDIGVCVPNT